MRMRTSLLGAAVLLAGACSGQEEKPYTVLPPSEVRHVFPWVDGQSAKVDRGWMPEKADVDLLESHLGEIAKLKPRCCVPNARPLRCERRTNGRRGRTTPGCGVPTTAAG